MRALSIAAWVARVSGATFLAVHGTCLAETEEGLPAASSNYSNPYAIISGRNVFHLNPPPLPEPAKGPAAKLPEVFLSGFMRTGDQWKALLTVKTLDSGPKAAKTSSYMTLAEGDRKGVVELVKIYAEQEKVDIVEEGTPVTLSLKDNSLRNQTSEAAVKSVTLEQRLARHRPTDPRITDAEPAPVEKENAGNGDNSLAQRLARHRPTDARITDAAMPTDQEKSAGGDNPGVGGPPSMDATSSSNDGLPPN